MSVTGTSFCRLPRFQYTKEPLGVRSDPGRTGRRCGVSSRRGRWTEVFGSSTGNTGY